jgi:acyl-CoA reductase-like NAD-dependent aldehyde dehydrogenase
VLADVRPMRAYEEELFGPLAAIIAARDEADAIRIARNGIRGFVNIKAVVSPEGSRSDARRRPPAGTPCIWLTTCAAVDRGATYLPCP